MRNTDAMTMTGDEPGAQTHPGKSFGLSIDVEDYFQVWAFSQIVARSSWNGFSTRFGENTRHCLDLFDAHNVTATFFTLGWIAERDKALMRDIVTRGHELASHGYDHTKVNQQSRAEFLADVQKTKSLLEDIAGVEVKGYRAAGFSIGPDTPWAHEVLAQAGHAYSSSTHPIKHDHYGDAQGRQTPYLPVEGASLIEAPVATVNIFGKRLSAAGGGWFRASPLAASKALLARASKTLDGPVIFYFHPWEIDPGQPRFNRAPLKSKLRHYINLDRMEGKLARLFATYPWRRIDETLGLKAAP